MSAVLGSLLSPFCWWHWHPPAVGTLLRSSRLSPEPSEFFEKLLFGALTSTPCHLGCGGRVGEFVTAKDILVGTFSAMWGSWDSSGCELEAKNPSLMGARTDVGHKKAKKPSPDSKKQLYCSYQHSPAPAPSPSERSRRCRTGPGQPYL